MITTLFGNDEQLEGAQFSPCRTYRYSLWRFWGEGSRIAFIGLNPSTADETEDDPTIRRCIGFAKRYGYAGLYMLNLFAFRATDPKAMRAAADPVGPENDATIRRIADQCEIVVACWGAHGGHRNRDQEVQRIDASWFCFGVTKEGYPKHPLYLANQTSLIEFNPRTPGKE